MAKKPTRAEKAAKTLLNKDPLHFKKIAAEAGKKTIGTFKTKRGLAKSAGIKSGQARRIKAIKREIEELEMAIKHLPEHESEHEHELLRGKKLELQKAECDYAGVHYVDHGTSITEYMQ